jgi:lipopolysaccharide export system protein LptC
LAQVCLGAIFGAYAAFGGLAANPMDDAMTVSDNLHSTIVAWLKILLPLIALAILSTLFLVSRTVDPSEAIPYATVDIDERVKEPRLTAPTWAGVTDDGAALSISADEARPRQSETQGPSAQGISALLETPDGGAAQLVAQRGQLDKESGALVVEGGVVITTSTGYRLTTEKMSAALDRTQVISEGAVTGTGPVGQIDAGSMEIRHDDSAGDGGAGAVYLLVFKKGVKLLYLPPK